MKKVFLCSIFLFLLIFPVNQCASGKAAKKDTVPRDTASSTYTGKPSTEEVRKKQELSQKLEELKKSKKDILSKEKQESAERTGAYYELPGSIEDHASKKSDKIDEELKKLGEQLKKLEKGVTGVEPERARAPSAPAQKEYIPQISLKAASHDDNEEFPFYQRFCSEYGHYGIPSEWNIKERYVIRVVDRNKRTFPHARIAILNSEKAEVFRAYTLASGELILFPPMDLDENYQNIESYSIRVNREEPVRIQKSPESVIFALSENERAIPSRIPVQICFLLDATGSMGDEIQQLKDVIFTIHSRISRLPARPDVAFSVVAYRDQGDAFVVKGSSFTKNIDTFQVNLESVQAGGGGDYPEDVEAGLKYTLDSLAWDTASYKFVFHIADAPPHVKKHAFDYLDAARQARLSGIMICPIGASGLNVEGEYIYRQIAALTHGEYVFLHYGEQGESQGTGSITDPGKVSHHTGSNYTVRTLDDIVVDIVTRELGYLTPDKLIVHTFPEPAEQSDFLDTRLTNLLMQVFKQGLLESSKTVVLPPVACSDKGLSALSEYLWEVALDKIPEIASVKLIERKNLEKILREHALSQTGVTDSTFESKIGKLANADYVLISQLHFLGAVRVCHMRLVDCVSGNIMSSARVRL